MKQYSLEDVRATKGQTDWEALKSSENYDGEAEFEVDWTKSRVGMPEAKRAFSLRLDPDILEFFKSEGKGYQTRMNAVLRAYMEARKAG